MNESLRPSVEHQGWPNTASEPLCPPNLCAEFRLGFFSTELRRTQRTDSRLRRWLGAAGWHFAAIVCLLHSNAVAVADALAKEIAIPWLR